VELDERQKRVADLIARLTTDVPLDKPARTDEQNARWILAYTLDWHRRELKCVYWERYRLADLPHEDLIDERSALAGLTFVDSAGSVHRCRFAHSLSWERMRG
jgi:uncharacterized protein